VVNLVLRYFILGALLSSVSSCLLFLVFAVVFIPLSFGTMHTCPLSAEVEVVRESGAEL